MSAPGEQPGPCPCPRPDCPAWTFKAQKNGHAVGCVCSECTHRSNRAKGARTEARRHAELRSRRAPDDEKGTGYPIRVTTQDKTGKQVPALFWQTMAGGFMSHAMKQARDAVPIGSPNLPALFLEHDDGRAYLVVEVSGRSWR